MWLMILLMAIFVIGSMMALRHSDDVDDQHCQYCPLWDECQGKEKECPWRSA